MHSSMSIWLAEWGFPSAATSSAQDQDRARSVAELRAYFLQVFREERLGGIFWYVWNEPDQDSIYLGGMIMEAGKRAVAPCRCTRSKGWWRECWFSPAKRAPVGLTIADEIPTYQG